MSKLTIGEKLFDALFAGDYEILDPAEDVDAAIRREKAKAWDSGYMAATSDLLIGEISDNPHRGRAKR